MGSDAKRCANFGNFDADGLNVNDNNLNPNDNNGVCAALR